MGRLMLVALGLLAGCGDSGADEPGGEPGMSGVGTSDWCNTGARTGLYWIDYTTLSGNCGPMVDGLEQVGTEPGEGCARTAADEWSDNYCTLTRSVLCDGTVEIIGVLTAGDADANTMTGPLTVTVYDSPGGAMFCRGSYSVVATRQ